MKCKIVYIFLLLFKNYDTKLNERKVLESVAQSNYRDHGDSRSIKLS